MGFRFPLPYPRVVPEFLKPILYHYENLFHIKFHVKHVCLYIFISVCQYLCMCQRKYSD